MDNDDLRRGVATCHKNFDEATAILAGDGLLTYAFEIISSEKTSANAEIRCNLISSLANAAGAFDGMIAGQILDLLCDDNLSEVDKEETIYKIEEMKTGRLIRFACEAGAILGNAKKDELDALSLYSKKIGMAFQIADDILDVEGNQKLAGKALNKDVAQGKLTFVGLYGLDNAKKIAQDLISEAKQALEMFGPSALVLKELAEFVISRKY